MPMQKRLEIIKVTTDVYDVNEATQHYREEERAGLYAPLLHITKKDVHGATLTSYCVCRIPSGPDDAAFIASAKRIAQLNDRKAPFVYEVPKSELFVLQGGKISAARNV